MARWLAPWTPSVISLSTDGVSEAEEGDVLMLMSRCDDRFSFFSFSGILASTGETFESFYVGLTLKSRD